MESWWVGGVGGVGWVGLEVGGVGGWSIGGVNIWGVSDGSERERGMGPRRRWI